MMSNQMNRNQLMQWLNMVSFAVDDIALYLDTHPEDEEALKYFDYYVEQRKVALCAYAEKYGPLTIDTARTGNYWDWSDVPLPWEGGMC